MVRGLGDTSVTGDDLITSAASAKRVTTIPDEILELGLSRTADKCISDKAWKSAAIALNIAKRPQKSVARHTSDTSTDPAAPHIKHDLTEVAKELQADIQQRYMIKAIVDMMRGDSRIQDIHDFLVCIETEMVQNADVRIQVQELAILVRPWSAASLAALGDLRNKYMSDTTLKFHKSLILFPTGVLIMDAAETVRLKWLEDDSCAKDLNAIIVPAAPLLEDLLPLKPTVIHLPNDKAWKKCVINFEKVKAKASDKFASTHASELERVSDAIKAASGVLTVAVRASIHREFESLSVAVEAVSAEDPATFSSAQTCCGQIIAELPSSKTMGLEALGVAVAKSLDEEVQAKSDMVVSMQSGIEVLKTGDARCAQC